MEPMDRLRQALEVAAEFPGPSMVADLAGAARLVLEGERIWWCETHGEVNVEQWCPGGPVSTALSRFADVEELPPCRMVERLLTEVPEDKEKTG